MAVEKSEAIILKTQPFQESSKIVRLYSKDFGKISVIAKGARRPKSPLRAVLETGYHVEVIFYFKEGRDLFVLSQCDLLNSFQGLHDNFDRSAMSMAVLELINGSSVGPDINTPLFDQILMTMNAIDSAQKNYSNYYWNFALHLLNILGFRFDVQSCIGCGSALSRGKLFAALKKGGVLCSICGSKEMVDFSVSLETIKLLGQYASLPPADVSRFVPSRYADQEINELLHRFMIYHLEGYKRPASLSLLE